MRIFPNSPHFAQTFATLESMYQLNREDFECKSERAMEISIGGRPRERTSRRFVLEQAKVFAPLICLNSRSRRKP